MSDRRRQTSEARRARRPAAWRLVTGRFVAVVALISGVPTMASAQVLGLPGGAVGAAPIRTLLTDSDALADWIATHSADATAAAARVEQAQAAFRASRLRVNPVLTTGLAGLPVGSTNPPGLSVGESMNYGASVAQPFEIGKRGPRSAAARWRVVSERDGYATTLRETMADARASIAQILYFKSRQAAIADDLETARQILDLQRVRFERGDLSGIDLDRLELDVQVLQSDLARTASDLREQQAICASLLFAACEPGDAGLDAVTALLQPVDTPLPPGWDAQLGERPDVHALDAQQHAAEMEVELARRRRLPDPVLSAGYTRDRFVISGNNPRTLAVGVSVPLPLFDRGQHDMARAAAEASEWHAAAAALTTRARVDAESLRDREQSLSMALTALRDGALSRATSVFTSTNAAVGQGELSTTDLLLARRTRTEVTLRVMELQRDLFLVQNELRHVLGTDTTTVRRLEGARWTMP